MSEPAKGTCNAMVQEKWADFIGQLMQQQRNTKEYQSTIQNNLYDDGVNIQIMSWIYIM